MLVAPFTGAWIETEEEEEKYDAVHVAPFTGAWIETVQHHFRLRKKQCRTLHGCVD